MDRATRRSCAILMAESPFSRALIIAARVVSDSSGLGAGFLGFGFVVWAMAGGA